VRQLHVEKICPDDADDPYEHDSDDEEAGYHPQDHDGPHDEHRRSRDDTS
jgi:hypothetical protein